MTTKHADTQQKHESKSNPEQQTIDAGQEQIPNLFSLSGFSQPAPRNVMQMQRALGNAQTVRVLSGQQMQRTLTPRIQRATSVTGAGGMSMTDFTFGTNFTYKSDEKPMWGGDLKAQFEFTATPSIKFSWAEALKKAGVSGGNIGGDTKGNGSESEASIKASVDLWKNTIKAQESEKDTFFGGLFNLNEHLTIKDVKLEGSYKSSASNAVDSKTKKEKNDQKWGIGASLVVTTLAGVKYTLSLSAFEINLADPAKSKGPGLSASGAVQLVQIPSSWVEEAKKLGLEITGGLTVTPKISVWYDPAALAKRMIQSAVEVAGGQSEAAIAGAAEGGSTGSSGVTAAGAVTVGFLVGAVITIWSYVRAVQDIQDLGKLRDKANTVGADAANGFMAGMHMPRGHSTSDEFVEGEKQGRVLFSKLVAAKTNELNSPENVAKFGEVAANYTDKDIEAMVEAFLIGHEEEVNNLYGRLMAQEPSHRKRLADDFLATHAYFSKMEVYAAAGIMKIHDEEERAKRNRPQNTEPTDTPPAPVPDVETPASTETPAPAEEKSTARTVLDAVEFIPGIGSIVSTGEDVYDYFFPPDTAKRQAPARSATPEQPVIPETADEAVEMYGSPQRFPGGEKAFEEKYKMSAASFQKKVLDQYWGAAQKKQNALMVTLTNIKSLYPDKSPDEQLAEARKMVEAGRMYDEDGSERKISDWTPTNQPVTTSVTSPKPTIAPQQKSGSSKMYTPSPKKAPASAQEASQQDTTPIPFLNNASGRSDVEQADAEEQERHLRAANGITD